MPLSAIGPCVLEQEGTQDIIDFERFALIIGDHIIDWMSPRGPLLTEVTPGRCWNDFNSVPKSNDIIWSMPRIQCSKRESPSQHDGLNPLKLNCIAHRDKALDLGLEGGSLRPHLYIPLSSEYAIDFTRKYQMNPLVKLLPRQSIRLP